MAGFLGNNAYFQWIYSGGTVLLQAKYRTWSYTPSVDKVEQSGGSDTAKSYLSALTDGVASWGGVLQVGSVNSLATALLEGTNGTLTVGIEGTITGKSKLTLPLMSGGLKYNIQYNTLVEATCDFQQNGTRVEATW